MLTEAEIAALDDGAPIIPSDAPPTTTAPDGASVEQVEAGMREGRGRADRYAQDGSLAEDTSREGREKKDGEPRLEQKAPRVRS